MKKILLYVAIAIGATSLFSCQEDIEIWDSATLDYSGRFLFEVLDETGTTVYESYNNDHIMSIYNSASNVENEVWLDETEVFPIKCKQILNGKASAFSSASLNFVDLQNNAPAVVLPSTKPTGVGETVTLNRDYLRLGIQEAKILKGAATTIGGNVADSLYMKVILYSGTATFNSYEKPVSLWADPLVPEFAWALESVAYDNTLDEIYIIAGHRYTGMPEDHY